MTTELTAEQKRIWNALGQLSPDDRQREFAKLTTDQLTAIQGVIVRDELFAKRDAPVKSWMNTELLGDAMNDISPTPGRSSP